MEHAKDRKQVLRIGIGGPVGSGKTALVDALCKSLRDEYRIAVVRPQRRPTCSDCGECMPNPASLGFISPKYFQLLFYDLTHMLYGVLLVYFRGVAGTGRERP